MRIDDDLAVPVRPLSDVRAIAATAVGLLLVSLVALASGGSPWHAGGERADDADRDVLPAAGVPW